MGHQHRSVPCPAQGVALQFTAVGAVAAAVAVSAHRDGMAAMRQARDDRAAALWQQRLQHARVSSANALSVARQAVARVHDLEVEVAQLRRAVASRDTLIRSLANDG